MFENRVLRRIFGPKRDEITEEWRKLHNEEHNPLNAETNPICHPLALLGAHHILHVSGVSVNDLYCSPNIVRVIKSRRMRWTGYVASMGERRGEYRVLVGKPEGKSPVGSPRRMREDNIMMDLQGVGRGYGLDRAG